ncbi:MAG: AAC(3) family N-acetyltransferase [Chloroflexota bacterium]
MLEVTRAQLEAALGEIGITAGSGLLVHSAVQYLGRPVGGLGMYMDALQAVLGPGGTLAAPAFNFAFAHGQAYDPLETPSHDMGAFSEYVRRLPQARRTPHPLQSLAVIGRDRDDLAGRDTPGAFDPGSAFERMLELDYSLLLLGANEKAISMFHYSEQRAGVPYRYWKSFTAPYRTPQGWQERTYRMFVRDEKIQPALTLDPLLPVLRRRGQWREAQLNYGRLTACRLADFVAAVDELLAQDPWCFVIKS